MTDRNFKPVWFLFLFTWKIHIRMGGKLLYVIPLYNYVSSFWKQIIPEKRSMGKQLLLTCTLNTLLPLDSSATTSIAYKLVVLLIKRRNFLVKQSESILYETNVCFNRTKSLSFLIWTFKKMRNLFCILCNWILHHMVCSVWEITHVHRICKISLFTKRLKNLYRNQQRSF